VFYGYDGSLMILFDEFNKDSINVFLLSKLYVATHLSIAQKKFYATKTVNIYQTAKNVW
jgi:hypothetical protein